MTYTRNGEQVTLEMTIEDYEQLLVILGFATGAAAAAADRSDNETFYRWLAFTNELNRTNPNYTPYEIPEEYRRK